ncbi:type II toxin-antitoxin system RelE/ParE family toxin [uncultured Sphingomonas sp.]|uniref:type II toxin-antitoxin system RelE/ParE family toxin n=1 Tax=uncultured Sphingomonas sp. TaxID=158754 RepID=UPI0035CA7543
MIVNLCARARADLREISAFTAERYGEPAAVEYLRAVDTALARLCDHLEIGEAYPERPGLRGYPVGRHRVFYRIEVKASWSRACCTRRWMRDCIFERTDDLVVAVDPPRAPADIPHGGRGRGVGVAGGAVPGRH